ncbi:MAG: alpha/beta hydrolase [Bordetella sp.]|nr:alpha/beta hydrolase [Bordetella sp.]
MQTLQIANAGAVLAVTTQGQGAPVVFLHANVCDSGMWEAELAATARTHLAVAYDRRGHGQSRAGAEDYSAVGDLLAVLDATAGPAPATLVACSGGARIAVDTALRHPKRVRSLVLVSPTISGAPPPDYPEPVLARMNALKQAEAAGDIEAINRIKAHLFLDGPLQPEGRVGGAVRERFLAMHRRILLGPRAGTDMDAEPAWPQLGKLEAPTLAIWGEYDFPHIQARARALVQGLPRAQGHALRQAAHLPGLEQPAESAALITGFLHAD